MKLISMTDFVLDINTKIETEEMFELHGIDLIFNYAKFLKKPLKLEMFVPCDEGGNVMEAPIQMDYFHFEGRPAKYPQECYEFDLKKFEQAEEKVLFEGFKSVYNAIVNQKNGYLDTSLLKGKDIEFLVKTDLTLTENALKQIGL